MDKNCDNCFKIKCKNCGWEPDEVQVQQIINKELKDCPDCGAKP